MTAEPKRPRKTGRPSKFDLAFVEQARKLCALGATDMDLADFFGVTRQTIHNWQHEHAAFFDATRVGASTADDRVERSLYHRAVGYTYNSEEVRVLRDGTIVRVPTITHVPPDTTAASLWLRNRRPDKWRDKVDVTVRRDLSEMDDAQLERIARGGGNGVAGPPPRSH